MIPLSTLIAIRTDSETPIYRQICQGFIHAITSGFIQRNSKIPGTRILAQQLGIHRNTVVAALEELQAQGWIKIIPSSGAYVSLHLPIVRPDKLQSHLEMRKYPSHTGYSIQENNSIDANVYTRTSLLEINDGLPDERLAPMAALSRAMGNVLLGKRGKLNLSYSPVEGCMELRTALADHLNSSRGFAVTSQDIIITRGTIMALYLSFQVLLKKGDKVIVGELSYRSANMIVNHLGGDLRKVPVDHEGLCIDSIEKICRQTKVRAIYLTPHHHYPTTVTMPPGRRIALLNLAYKYGIAVIEDDYDYDYHYSHRPFLPLASSDPHGMVIYIGSFSKTFSPALRVGYIVAPQNFIAEVAKLRRIIDRQGDNVLEMALAELFKAGEIKNHLRKSLQAYQLRRDLFCKLLQEELSTFIHFDIPEGGMAIWAKFDPLINLPELSIKAKRQGLFLSDGNAFKQSDKTINATRLGFASLDLEEINRAVGLLRKCLLS